MIDNKKIVEASKKYAKEMEETCKKLAKKYKSATSLCNLVTVNPEAAFQDGINWFLKNLWHSVSEEPEKFRKILYTGGSIDTTYTTMLIINNSWNTKVHLLKIKKWCYIDDLFPKEGGNYD